MENNKSSDILIIGGGIIGAMLAYWLCRREAKVRLLEATPHPADGRIGAASFASAGIVAPPSKMDTPPHVLELEKYSLKIYGQIAEELKTQQSSTFDYIATAQLSVAANGAEVRSLQKRQRWHESHSFESRWLLPEEVSEIEPLAGPNFGALYNPALLFQVRWLTTALLEAAKRDDLMLQFNSRVAGLLIENGQVAGVKLENGDTIRAGKVVLAGGAWSGVWLDKQLAELNLPSPGYSQIIFPVRGQMLAIQPPSDLPPLRNILMGGHGYALPRQEGTMAKNFRVVIGATAEPDGGFEPVMTPAGFKELGVVASKLVPSLVKAPIRETWAGLRPGSKDDAPLLGPMPELPGLWLATGHFRRGVTIAPASAELLSDALLNETPAGLARLEPFSPKRFTTVA